MPRKRKRIPQIITPKELETIMQFLLKPKNSRRPSKADNFARLRNCVAIYLMYYLGLRPKESTNIKISHINLERKTLFIPAQNNKQRNADIMPIPDFILEKIIFFIQLTRSQKIHSEWLFPSISARASEGRAKRGSYIRAFRHALKDADMLQTSYIDEQGNQRHNITLYSLRHSFGTLVLQKTKNYRKAAKALRHYDDQCRSVLIYDHTTDHVEREEILQEVYF